MLEELRCRVYQANMDLVREGLAIQTWGNASGLDPSRGLMAIKPSGVPYANLTPAHMVIVEVQSGRVVEGKLNPSSDTATHLELYRAFTGIGGVVHTHSMFATAWAQSRKSIPALGTTHADYFHGPVPCTRQMTPSEIEHDYEASTGLVIVETFHGCDPLACPAVLVASHGPFAWGDCVESAAHNAFVLEHVARLAAETVRIFPSAEPMQQVLMDKHFFRKHGPSAYYGQGKSGPGVCD